MGRSFKRDRDKDPFYRRAKEEGYLSRAAYKLEQICERYNILSPGDTVLDLGAAPGGWSQIARELVGEDGRVVAVDLRPIEAEDVTIVRGDLTEDATLEKLRRAAEGPVDAVVSDMSPKLSGNYSMDHARSVHLAGIALDTAQALLRPGGSFVVKVFQGDMYKEFYDRVGEAFDYHTAFSPEASRKESSETYVIGERFHGR